MNAFVIGLGVLNLCALMAGWILYRVWFVQPPPAQDNASMFVFEIEEEQRGLNLPPAWAKRLSSEHIRVQSIVEGGLQIVALGLDRYTSELSELVDKVQLAFDTCDDLEMSSQARRLQALLEQRLPELQEFTDQLERRKDADAEHLRFANQLCETLSDEVADVSDAIHKISQLNFARDAKQAGEVLNSEVHHVFDLAVDLRKMADDMLEDVVAISASNDHNDDPQTAEPALEAAAD